MALSERNTEETFLLKDEKRHLKTVHNAYKLIAIFQTISVVKTLLCYNSLAKQQSSCLLSSSQNPWCNLVCYRVVLGDSITEACSKSRKRSVLLMEKRAKFPVLEIMPVNTGIHHLTFGFLWPFNCWDGNYCKS